MSSIELQGVRKSPFVGWLSSKYAVHWIVALIFLVNNFFTGFIFPSDTAVQPGQIQVHIYDFITGVAGASTLILFRGLTKNRAFEKESLGFSFSAWVSSAAVALLVPALTEYFVVGPTYLRHRVEGFLFGLESYVAQFATFTLIVAAVSAMRAASFELASNRYQLQEIQANLASDISEMQSEIDRQVNLQISPVLEELRAAIAQSSKSHSADLKAAIPQIKAAIDQVVRPLSHDLGMATNIAASIEIDTNQSIPQIRKKIFRMSLRDRWLMSMPLSASFQPALGPLNVMLFVCPSIVFLFDIRTLLTLGLPAVVLMGFALVVIRQLVAKIHLPYLAANLCGVVVNILVSVLFFVPLVWISVELDLQLVNSLAIGSAIILLLSGYFGLVVERRLLFLDQARMTNEGIASTLTRMRHELLISKRQLGRLLHGGVQARLQASMLRISRAEMVSESVIREVLSDLDEAESILIRSETDVPETLGAQMDDLIDFWDGICDVEMSMTREFDERVSKDAIAVQCLIEVVREVVANAVKHGGSKSVCINLDSDWAEVAKLIIHHEESDEQPLAQETQGLGSHIYGDLTSSWSLRKTGNIVTFEATVLIKI